jgi:hypothetical protein
MAVGNHYRVLRVNFTTAMAARAKVVDSPAAISLGILLSSIVVGGFILFSMRYDLFLLCPGFFYLQVLEPQKQSTWWWQRGTSSLCGSSSGTSQESLCRTFMCGIELVRVRLWPRFCRHQYIYMYITASLYNYSQVWLLEFTALPAWPNSLRRWLSMPRGWQTQL